MTKYILYIVAMNCTGTVLHCIWLVDNQYSHGWSSTIFPQHVVNHIKFYRMEHVALQKIRAKIVGKKFSASPCNRRSSL